MGLGELGLGELGLGEMGQNPWSWTWSWSLWSCLGLDLRTCVVGPARPHATWS